MSQKQDLLEMFRAFEGRITLGMIMRTTLAAEYRARITELRHEGYRVDFKRGATPSENLYTLVEFEQSGQGILI